MQFVRRLGHRQIAGNGIKGLEGIIRTKAHEYSLIFSNDLCKSLVLHQAQSAE
jgi:hypothetical protein